MEGGGVAVKTQKRVDDNEVYAFDKRIVVVTEPHLIVSGVKIKKYAFFFLFFP